VSERNALAKQLRADGDKAAADEVRRLKKPTVPAWAINHAVQADPDSARRVIEAGERLAAAQQQGDGDELRGAMEAGQSAIEEMMERVQEALRSEDQDRPGNVDRARETLRAVATDEQLREEFEAARIAKDREAIGFGAAPTTAAPRPSAESKATEEARREQRRRLKAAERARETASKRAARAKDRRDRARQDLEKAQNDLDAAESELERASQELDAAQTDADS
jgi:hypothetical protein